MTFSVPGQMEISQPSDSRLYENDTEKHAAVDREDEMEEDVAEKFPSGLKDLVSRISNWGVEVRGIEPVPMSEKTKDNYINMFGFWVSMLTNFLPISTGMTGTLAYGLSLRDAVLVIVFFNLLCFAVTAWAALMGVRLGFRQMIHARYAFG